MEVKKKTKGIKLRNVLKKKSMYEYIIFSIEDVYTN